VETHILDPSSKERRDLMDTPTALYLAAAVLIVVGLLGTVLPVLPGLPLMFGGMLLAAWAGGFQDIPVWVIVVLAVLTLVGLGIDLLATVLGAQRVGASKKPMLGAALGIFAGLFFGIPGLLAGPFAGAVIGELIHGREWRAASKIGFGAWLGLALGAALKLGLAFAMLGIFAIALWVK